MSEFQIAALPAQEGDCLVISYGADSADHHIVIDAGRKGTAPRLAQYLADGGITALELLVVTHVDADHIEGMLDFLEEHPDLPIGDIWFNGYRHLLEALDPMGAPQGERLTDLIRDRPWNEAAGGRAIRLDDDDRPHAMPQLTGGMDLTVLSPSRTKLARMEPVWVSECAKAGIIVGEEVVPEPVPAGLVPMGGDLFALADTVTQLDSAPANGTSIALLAEFAGKRVLLGADAHGDLLCASLRQLSPNPRYPVNLLKAPHHGSQANVTQDLVAALDCSNFLVSTSGARFKHPDQVAIARMITGSPRPAKLYFNYDQPKTRYWIDRGRTLGEPEFACTVPVEGEPLIIDIMRDT